MTRPPFIPFGGRETQAPEMASARVVVVPFCYENAVSYGTGCGDGPLHLLAASAQLERLDEETLEDWAKTGVYTLAPMYPPQASETAIGQMKHAAEKIFKAGKFPLFLGGDHAVSIGPLMAAADRFPDMAVVQVDAHLDLRDEWNGSRFNHACVMRRVVDDMGLPVVQVGVRSISAEEASLVEKRHMKPIYAHGMDVADSSWIDGVIERLPGRIYLTIDLDGLDPSVIPGTGTPEPGGLSYRQLIALIKALGRNRQVVGADIVELSKIEGTQVSEATAAKIATKIMVHCL